MTRTIRFFLLLAIFCGATLDATLAQVVSVTLSLDTNRIAIGETTTLHVYAQIIAPRRASTDRIFSWYVDLLNATGTAARINADALAKPSSDKDPRTSSSGTAESANRRGIYDTFLNLAGAGRDTRVELFSVPVQGTASGTATFSVTAGSGVTGLGADFIVAPLGGGDPLLGGDYSAASVTLQVSGGVPGPTLSLSLAPTPDGLSQRVTLTFPTTAGQNHFVEFRDSLSDGAWQSLPSGPHNSGSVVDTTSAPVRFYRLRVGN